MRRIALLCTSAAWMAGQGFSASKLNLSGKRAMEFNPAVVRVSVKYQVNGRFQVGGETVSFGPVAVGGTGSSAILTGMVLPTYRERKQSEPTGTVPEMISAVHLANGAEYRADTKTFSDPIDRGGKDVAILKINAGTPVTVRMIGSVDSSRDRPGRRFEASVDEPVMAGARTVIPRGASRGKRSAEVIGGGAAAGAVIGGIFGHKRGAATGEVAGAGAGTGAQYMSNAEPVTIPSETRIDFTLRTPVTLTP